MNDFKLPLLIYDDECKFCLRFAQGILHFDRDKKINLVSVYEEDLFNIFPQIKREECHETVHLIDDNGRVYRGEEVILYLVNLMPKVSKLAWLLKTDAGKKSVEVFYKKVNSLRKKMRDECKSCGKRRHEHTHGHKFNG